MIQDKVHVHIERLQINGEDWEVIDQVTGIGLETMATKLGSNTTEESWMPFLAIGDGVTLPSSEDTTLESEVFRKRGTVTVIKNTYFIEADFAVDEPTDDTYVREVGIFDAVSGGNMGARWTLVDEVLKEYDIGIHIKIAISIT